MPRSTTGLSYLTLILVVLGAFIFTIFVISPQWADYKIAQAELLKEQDKFEERKEFLASIDARKKELDSYAKDALALSVMLPDRQRPANTLALLQGLASGSGVLVMESSEPRAVSPTGGSTAAAAASPVPGQAQAGSQLLSYETNIRIRGSYAQTRNFLRDLERSLLFTDVQAVDLQGIGNVPDGTPAPDQLEGKLVLRTYVQQVPR